MANSNTSVSFSKLFLKKYPQSKKVLFYFKEATGVDATWNNITKIRLELFMEYMKERLARNCVKTYAAKFRAVMNLGSDEHHIPSDYGKVLSIKKDSSQNVYITDDEIKKLIGYQPKTKGEQIVKTQFLMGCLTGARHSDYINFTKCNLMENDMMSYVSVKTHTTTIVPTAPYIKTLLKEIETPDKTQHVTSVYFNIIIKRIFKNLGLTKLTTLYYHGETVTKPKYEFITSHTARRSFATNLYLNNVDIYTISKFCGHSSVEMTSAYICCGPKIDKNVKSYFSQFK